MIRFKGRKDGGRKINTEKKERLSFLHRIRNFRWPFSRRDTLLGTVILLNFCIILGFTAEAYMTHKKMEQLVYQMSYLNDTNSILLTDVNNMQSDIKQTLEEEASLLESWEIALDDMDFANETYTVNVTIVPKEFTETMTATVYFGTHAFPLKLNGFLFSGMAELTLDEAYDGNVTVLFADGKSRKTEVLSDYSDVRTDLTQVLYGKLSSLPAYENGMLNLDENGYVRLDAGDFFSFESLELIVEEDEQLIKEYDLAAMSNGDNISIVDENGSEIDDGEAEDNAADGNSTGGSLTDSDAGTGSTTAGSGMTGSGTAGSGMAGDGMTGSGTTGSTMAGSKTTGSTTAGDGMTGSGTANGDKSGAGRAGQNIAKGTLETVYAATMTDDEQSASGESPASDQTAGEAGSNLPLTWLAYSYMISDSISVPETGHIRIYLKAVSENGFVFTYDLLNFDIVDDNSDGQDAAADNADGAETGAEAGTASDPTTAAAETALAAGGAGTANNGNAAGGNGTSSGNGTNTSGAGSESGTNGSNTSSGNGTNTSGAGSESVAGGSNTGSESGANASRNAGNEAGSDTAVSDSSGAKTGSDAGNIGNTNDANPAAADEDSGQGESSVLDSILEIFDNGENYGIIDEDSISWESYAAVYDSDGNVYWLTE